MLPITESLAESWGWLSVLFPHDTITKKENTVTTRMKDRTQRVLHSIFSAMLKRPLEQSAFDLNIWIHDWTKVKAEQ